MKKGKLIVIEGGDGSGKETQSKLLLKYLGGRGKATYFDFPQYDKTVFGSLVGRCLSGDFGDFLHLSPYLSSLPYILDRATAKEKIISALKNGNVVCNRYTPSNIVFQAAKVEGKDRADLITFLEKGEYDEIGLPRPDLVLYLDVPQKISTKLVERKESREYLGGEKQGAKDQHEKDLEYQEKVTRVYRQFSKKYHEWQVISCVKDGKILPPTLIHQSIVNIVDRFFSAR